MGRDMGEYKYIKHIVQLPMIYQNYMLQKCLEGRVCIQSLWTTSNLHIFKLEKYLNEVAV